MRSWLRRSQGALAGVKANLRSVSREEETLSVLVASSVSKEGASTTAVSMAYALAALRRSRVCWWTATTTHHSCNDSSTCLLSRV
ncbi:hypothetical protein [Magnetofaba australis]|uniref:hypothetical protein n=1 Tax=Magnetofaba australis TaxID=1472297 RepID=UPI00117FF6AB|nr:hypothetical protein [Magnetofaba australis]